MLKVIKGDITRAEVEVIVNSANPRLADGGGVCGAIWKAAGRDNLHQYFSGNGFRFGCHTGEAVMTPGFDLPAHKIIHVVAPKSDNATWAATLVQAYGSVMGYMKFLKIQHGYTTVAIPSLGTGIYGGNLESAAQLAYAALKPHIRSFDITIMDIDKDTIEVFKKVMKEDLNG